MPWCGSCRAPPAVLGARRRSFTGPFGIEKKRTSLLQEVLAEFIGWQTVVSSFAFYASLFVGDDEDVNQDATVEVFLIVAGLSTLMFGVAFNVPFIVAPSVLYAAREPGTTMGGHLAAQAVANLAAASFLAFALHLSFVSFTPTALRVGAGCGIAMLVSVLGLRSLGLLVSDSFTLQPFTWQSIFGLAIVTAACVNTSSKKVTHKFLGIVGMPMVLTIMVYAVFDRSKFQGYSSIEHPPLSNWGDGSFGVIDFSRLWEAPSQHLFYIIRTFASVTINISSILLVLIDAVCLEDVHSKLKSSEETDFSDAIGGTKKFRYMACSIPMMSCLGNLMGVTTQAAFVQSMILVFAGGKTGLSAAVTGALLILTSVLRPLLPVIVPPHVSGALTVVISLRFFNVIRMVDVSRPSNLLMFGISIMLIPFSFDFVNALCIAAVLGFVCETGDKLTELNFRNVFRGRDSKVAVSAGDVSEQKQRDCELGSLTEDISRPVTTTQEATTREWHRSGHTLPDRRHTVMHISSAPQSPARVGPQAVEGSMGPETQNRRQVYGARRILKSLSNRAGGSARSKASSRASEGRGTISEAPAVNLQTKQSFGDGGPVSLHWGLALFAVVQLVLSAVSDQINN